jgi:hypothetical protein
MKIWRIVAALAVWTGVILQLGLMVSGKAPAEALAAVVRFFSFFTILSNLAVAVLLTAPLLARTQALGRWAIRAEPRVAVAVYIGVTAAIYHTLLRGLWDPKGLQLLADILLHSITPALYLVDWFLARGEGRARWRAAVTTLIVPTLFGLWTLIHGAVSGWYPYPFLDVAKRGLPAVMVTLLILAAGFYALALAFTALQRRLHRPATAPGSPEVSEALA